MKSEILFCAMALSLVACSDDSSSSNSSGGTSQNLDAEYEYWLNQDNAGGSLVAPCNMNGVDNCSYGSLVDSRDGQEYRTVAIGNQVWMAENLNFAAHNSFCTKADCKEVGRLYSFGAVYDTSSTHCVYEEYCQVSAPIQGVCPTGWHVPTMSEWEVLFTNVGSKIYMNVLLKDSAWGDDFIYHDAYGFALTPSPDQKSRLRENTFLFLAYDEDSRYDLGFHVWGHEGRSTYVSDYDYDVPLGFSVRCLQDETGAEGTPSQMVEEVDSRTVAADYLNPAVEYGTLEDSRDGQTYKTVVIGENTWMAQNLNYSTGDAYSTCYDNSEALCKKFGRLYTEIALMQSDLCPTGWHISTYRDWVALRNVVAVDSGAWYTRLLAKDAWYFPDSADKTEDMDDGFGFSMLPSVNLYSMTMFAEGDEFGSPIYTHSKYINSAGDYASVRCVKDVDAGL